MIDAAVAPADDSAARATVTVGMTVALAAIAMTFAALLLAYGVVRAQSPAWPPPGEFPLPPLWGLRLAATAAALTGSVAMWVAARGLASGTTVSRTRAVPALVSVTVTGVVFLALQFASLRALGTAGVHPSSGLAASVIYALTAFHGLHALAAVLLSLGLLATWRTARPGRVLAVASFWHLVTVVWLVVFVAVFVA
jgi:heme/copper-type cytochrome/quinol oxidase subunit 3